MTDTTRTRRPRDEGAHLQREMFAGYAPRRADEAPQPRQTDLEEFLNLQRSDTT